MQALITGLQHAGIGVPDVIKARRQYYALHHMQIQLADATVHPDFFRPVTQDRTVFCRGLFLLNMGGGGGFQLTQLLQEKVQLPETGIAFGQPGINAVFLRCFQPDFVAANHKHYHIPLLKLTNPLHQTIWQGEDLYDNRFRFVPGDQPFGPGDMASGGVAGAMIGVRSIKTSLPFYQELLGFEKVLYDVQGRFADLPGATNRQFHRVLLYRPASETGAFSRIMGDACIELIQDLGNPRPVHFYADRSWGEPGFTHLGFETPDIDASAAWMESRGVKMEIAPTAPFALGKTLSRFAFCKDPDGTLIGFCQTMEIPLVNALGWKLKLSGRKTDKPIPNWKLGLLSTQKIGAKELAR